MGGPVITEAGTDPSGRRIGVHRCPHARCWRRTRRMMESASPATSASSGAIKKTADGFHVPRVRRSFMNTSQPTSPRRQAAFMAAGRKVPNFADNFKSCYHHGLRGETKPSWAVGGQAADRTINPDLETAGMRPRGEQSQSRKSRAPATRCCTSPGQRRFAALIERKRASHVR